MDLTTLRKRAILTALSSRQRAVGASGYEHSNFFTGVLFIFFLSLLIIVGVFTVGLEENGRSAVALGIEALSVSTAMALIPRFDWWWSAGIALAGVVLIIAFWQWCERRDFRRMSRWVSPPRKLRAMNDEHPVG